MTWYATQTWLEKCETLLIHDPSTRPRGCRPKLPCRHDQSALFLACLCSISCQIQVFCSSLSYTLDQSAILKAVPVQDVCILVCLPMSAVMFICLCACPLVCLSSVWIPNANANVLDSDGLKQVAYYLIGTFHMFLKLFLKFVAKDFLNLKYTHYGL